ncbi:MAG TPA: HlyD family efflux transporter periplasmic adaptor subunit [Microbacteriaceae bacterium]|nr:HlyD family efflux transporter periplasmic adaptor subunit [Microbacteriaceae bacterium]
MFRSRAVAKDPVTDLDRPFRLITAPAQFGLALAVIAAVCGLLWLFGGQIAIKTPGSGLIVNPPGNVSVFAPVSGTLDDSLVPAGTEVSAGDILATIATLDGQDISVRSPIDGTVVSLSTALWAQVIAGAPLITIAPNTSPMIGVLFVPVVSMADVQEGLRVEFTPATADPARDGFIIGEVASVDPLPATMERLQLTFGDDGLIQEILAQGPVQEVVVRFAEDPKGVLGLKWSGPGPEDGWDIESGTAASAKIVLRNQTPWQAFTHN